MRLSVLISIYHRESAEHLAEALDSLCNQTLPADEVVLVEDGPVGKELSDVVERYRDRLRIQSVRLTQNRGLGVALTEGLKFCRGAYVARMDGDDICMPDRFRQQVAYLDVHEAVAAVGTAIAEFGTDPAQILSVRRLPEDSATLRTIACRRNPLNHMTVMFRTESVRSVGGYQPIQGFEDYHLWGRMLARGLHLANLPDTLVLARCGNGMQQRRGGWQYLVREVELQRTLSSIGLITRLQMVQNILVRIPVRLVPGSVRGWLYRKVLRKA